MSAATFIPSFDNMPALGSLPDSVWPAVSLLAKVETVQDVVAMQEKNSITFYVKFSREKEPEYRKAIQCFSGLKPRELRLEGGNNYMQLKLQH
jgi:hypothetical protein